jgi:hypothetical protein
MLNLLNHILWSTFAQFYASQLWLEVEMSVGGREILSGTSHWLGVQLFLIFIIFYYYIIS